MKRTILSFFMLTISLALFAQATEGTVEYQKIQQPAAVIELPYTPDIVIDALNSYLSKKGKSKSGDIKGFTTYRNTEATVNDSTNADLYFKMERKSRKEKEVTVVSLLLTVPVDGTASESLHHLNMEQAKSYLNGLVSTIEGYSLEQDIKKQNESVVKSETKYRKLREDGDDFEKKRVSIEKNLEENKTNIQQNKSELQAQSREIEVQKQRLADLVSRRMQ